jgi:hypothetical protein
MRRASQTTGINMQTFILGCYVLIWPLVSLAILAVIGVATVKDIRTARREKRELV